MRDACIFDAVRTPRGRGKTSGALYTVRPVDLLITALRALRDRNDLDTSQVDDVIAGCVTQTGEQGGGLARVAALQAGYGNGVPGMTVHRFCSSGLDAFDLAAATVMAGINDLVVAGGVEHMSRVEMGSDGGPLWDVQTQWTQGSVPQGISADLLATLRGVTRGQVDAFALKSQQRAAAAQDAGAFARSIVPVRDCNGMVLLDVDELPRRDTSMEALAKLRPSFEVPGRKLGLDTLVRRRYPHVDRIDHVHTAGNSSGIVDGAAAILVGSEEKGRQLGLTPRARVRSVAAVAEEPLLMLTGPMPASRKALCKAGMEAGDVDLFEVNEAFAVVPLIYMEDLGVGHDRVNVNGGAIALGHPLGATGAVLVNTLLDALEERGLATGLVTLCVGGGMGVATIIERV